MPSPKRSVSDRLAVRAKGQRSPDPEVFKAVFDSLQCLAEQHENTKVTHGELVARARYLAGAITIYAETRRGRLPDPKMDYEEPLLFRETQAARLTELAREMTVIMDHPACQHLAMLPPDDQTLRELLQKMIDDHDNRTPAEEAKALRDAARPSPAKHGRGTPQGNRWMVCHALDQAWFIATGRDAPGRKHNVYQEPYGEFHDFISRVLSLTSETRHGVDADELHREILKMGE